MVTGLNQVAFRRQFRHLHRKLLQVFISGITILRTASFFFMEMLTWTKNWRLSTGSICQNMTDQISGQ